MDSPRGESLHNALGFPSPPWTSSLDTLVVLGGLIEGGDYSKRQHAHPIAGSTWSFRRLVVSLPLRGEAPHGRNAKPYQDSMSFFWNLLLPYTLDYNVDGRLPDRLEKIELRVGREREKEIKDCWLGQWRRGSFSAEGVRMARMIRFMDEGDEDGTEGRRLVEE